MRQLVLLALAAACGRTAPAPVEVADAAAAPIAEVVVPAPAPVVGEVETVRTAVNASGTARFYRDGKWSGNGSVAFSVTREARHEVLAVDGGRPIRMRFSYPRDEVTLRAGGEDRVLPATNAGRSYVVDLAGGLSVLAEGGAAVGADELQIIRQDVEDLARWAPIQGRALVLGQAIDGPPPWNAHLVLKSRGETTAKVAARLAMPLGGDAPVQVDGEATLDLATGRVARFVGDGTMDMARTSKVGKRGAMEVVGELRVKVVQETESRRSP